MIQRIQSIWLLLASLILFCLLFVPIASSTVGNVQYQIIASGLYEKTGNQSVKTESYLPLFISTIAVALTCLVNIFNFRKRIIQKRICLAIMLMTVGLSFWCSQAARKIPGGLETNTFNVGLFLPLAAIICCALAIRGINNDEKLIRSADRLR